MPYNGADLEPHYIPPNGPEVSDLNQSTKRYRGSCHCGNVTYDLHSEPLEDIGVLLCNCSICSRVGLRSPTHRYDAPVNDSNRMPISGYTPRKKTSSSEARSISPSTDLGAKEAGTLSVGHVVWQS